MAGAQEPPRSDEYTDIASVAAAGADGEDQPVSEGAGTETASRKTKPSSRRKDESGSSSKSKGKEKGVSSAELKYTTGSSSKGKGKHHDDDNVDVEYTASVAEFKAAREQPGTSYRPSLPFPEIVYGYEKQKRSGDTVDVQRSHQKLYYSALDLNDYKVHHSRYFVLGRVLKLFWFEPPGSNRRDASSEDESSSLYETGMPGKVRRFVIVETRRGHSTCIPVNTYGNRGTMKPGCHPQDHAIIYTGTQPQYLFGEAPLENPPIKMLPVEAERLMSTSRINYARKYTIEHNFRVKLIGAIARESSDAFWMSYNRVNCTWAPPPEPERLAYTTAVSAPDGIQQAGIRCRKSNITRSEVVDVNVQPSNASCPTQSPRTLDSEREVRLEVLSTPHETTFLEPANVATETAELAPTDRRELDKLGSIPAAADPTTEPENPSSNSPIVASSSGQDRIETIPEPFLPNKPDETCSNPLPDDEARQFPPPSYEEAVDAMRLFVQDNSLIAGENIRCQNALFVSWPAEDLANVRSRLGEPIAGTCRWILRKRPYKLWAKTAGVQILRLLGSQAVGKTTMMMFLIQEWTLTLKKADDMVLAYWFCDGRRRNTNTATSIVRGLLFQILQQRPHDYHYLQRVYDTNSDALFEDFEALWGVLKKVLEIPPEDSVVVLIDALDECDEHSRRLILDGLLEMSRTNIKVKVLFTERPGRTLVDERRIVTLPMDPEDIEMDVHKFTKQKVEILEEKMKLSSEQVASVTEALKANTAGTFPGLVVNMLSKIDDCDDMMKAVERIPEDATSAYREYLHPDQEESSATQNIFRLLDTLPGDPGGEYKSHAERELCRDKEAAVKPPKEVSHSDSSSSVPKATPESSDAGRDHLSVDCKAAVRSISLGLSVQEAERWKLSIFGLLVLLAFPPRLTVICGFIGFVLTGWLLFTTLEHALIAFQSQHSISIKQPLKQSRDKADSDSLTLSATRTHSPPAPITVLADNPYAHPSLPIHNGNQSNTNPARNSSAFIATITTLYGRFLTFLKTDDQDPQNPAPDSDPNHPATATDFGSPDGYTFWIQICLGIFILLGFLSTIAQTIACTWLSDAAQHPNYTPPAYNDVDFLELLASSGFLLIAVCFSMAVMAIHIAEHKDTAEWPSLYVCNFICFLTMPLSLRLYVNHKYMSKAIAGSGQLMQAVVNFLTILKLEQMAARQRWVAREVEMQRRRRASEEADRRHEEEIREFQARDQSRLQETQRLMEQLEALERRTNLRRRLVPDAGDRDVGDFADVQLEP